MDRLPFGEDDEQTPSSFTSEYMNVLGSGDHSYFCDYKLGPYGYPMDEDAKNQCKMTAKEDALTLEYDVNYKHEFDILKVTEMGAPTNPSWNPDIQMVYKVNISYIPCLRNNADELWNCEGEYLESQIVKMKNSDNLYFMSFFYYENTEPSISFRVQEGSDGIYHVDVIKVSSQEDLVDFTFQILDASGSIYTGTNVGDKNEIAMQIIDGKEHGIDRSYNGNDSRLESRVNNVSNDDGTDFPLHFNDNDRDGKLSAGDSFRAYGSGNAANGPFNDMWKLVIYYNYAYEMEIGVAKML
jgi:hypothetical protein